ncbi:MAG: hypothetical protein P4L40_14365 [Terracidiphilus sp.]|nr:hypothetical protein [Terracidiphilus sp.]
MPRATDWVGCGTKTCGNITATRTIACTNVTNNATGVCVRERERVSDSVMERVSEGLCFVCVCVCLFV